MRSILSSLVLSLLTLTAASGLAETPAAEGQAPVYTPGQYGAVLDQSSQRWRVQPLTGPHLVLTNHDPSCLSSAVLPDGLWAVGRDAHNRPELVALSDTPAAELPSVALRGCGEPAEGMVIRVPLAVKEALVGVGAVLIEG